MPSKDAQNVLVKLQQANQVMEDLIDLAMSDEKISTDEQQILFTINENLQEYVKLTIASVSDNVITEEEQQKLSEVRQKIINEAEKVAKNDEQVSLEEKKLLDSLVSAIKAMST